MNVESDPRVDEVFASYPARARLRIEQLRKLIIEAAEETDGLAEIEETLKWGEPSYLTKYGSTVRVDWKPKSPDQYAVYFKCTSKLVSTFREVYPKEFHFEGNRALVFSLDEEPPKNALKHCVKAALTYHKVKHLPLLGMGLEGHS